MSIKDVMLKNIAEPYGAACEKVTIVGVGDVGSSCAFQIISRNMSSEICLIHQNGNSSQSQVLDLQSAAAVRGNVKVTGGTDYSLTVCSRVCIVAVANRPTETETRVEHAQRCLNTLKKIIPKLMRYNPNTVLLVLTAPVDIATQYAWRLSGLPKNRVIGTGTTGETSLFRHLIAKKIGVPNMSDMAWVIGEHYDNCIPHWSGVNIAGTRLSSLVPDIAIGDDEWLELSNEVVLKNIYVKKHKGNTNWGDSISSGTILHAILRNTKTILTVSVSVQGLYGIKEDVWLSLPSLISSNGVTSIVKLTLSPLELTQIQTSAKLVNKIVCEVEN